MPITFGKYFIRLISRFVGLIRPIILITFSRVINPIISTAFGNRSCSRNTIFLVYFTIIETILKYENTNVLELSTFTCQSPQYVNNI